MQPKKQKMSCKLNNKSCVKIQKNVRNIQLWFIVGKHLRYNERMIFITFLWCTIAFWLTLSFLEELDAIFIERYYENINILKSKIFL